MSKFLKKQIQNLSELYFVYRLQEELTKNKMSINNSIHTEYKTEYLNYAKSANINLSEFEKTLYFSNVEDNIGNIGNILKELLVATSKKANIVQTMLSGRAEKKKGDFAIVFDDGKRINVSLKNYEKPLNKIQVCSGTWKTFLLNFLFDSERIGNFSHNGKVFSTKNNRDCIDQINIFCANNNIDASKIVELFNLSNDINEQAKDKYVRSDFASYLTEEVSNEWKKDCNDWAHLFIDRAIECLMLLPDTFLKKRFFEITGLTTDEELLLLSPSGPMFSLTNDSFKALVKSLQNITHIETTKCGKSIRISACRNKDMIISVDIPFTLNKNGAWHDEPTPRFSKIDNMIIQPGQRRPEKAKQLNTSVNGWLNIKESLYEI
jgi:hypothetical protein